MSPLARALAAGALALAAGAAAAQDSDWSARKCALYTDAWAHAATGEALNGVSADFLAAHEAFLSSGCREGRVCPVTGAELALADTLTLMSMAEGMASTFVPFACPG